VLAYTKDRTQQLCCGAWHKSLANGRSISSVGQVDAASVADCQTAQLIDNTGVDYKLKMRAVPSARAVLMMWA
jgi:hypothetical protein